jgi:sarcosine oxidase
MPERYDAIVLGLGGMGSSALAWLARRGRRVLGLEQFQPAHASGSSHGGSRIIRKAYYEHPAYVPLVLRAYDLWQELEQSAGTQLLLPTGGLMSGPPGCEIVDGALQSARQYGLAYELLDCQGIQRQFPAFRPLKDEVGVYEPDAGVLFPERCVLSNLQSAVSNGAEARFGVHVEAWAAGPNSVSVHGAGIDVEAQSLVLTAGSWTSAIAADLGLPLKVERNVMHWFDPQPGPGRVKASGLPIWVLDRLNRRTLYGFPWIPDQGVKAAFHYSNQYTTPDEIERTVAAEEVEEIRSALREWLPEAAGASRDSVVCMYTNSPDRHFLVGLHPKHPNVAIAAGFSGHGFKFCPVVGEILSELVLDGRTRHDIQLFSLSRFRR